MSSPSKASFGSTSPSARGKKTCTWLDRRQRASVYSFSSRPFRPEYSNKASEFSLSPQISPRAPRALCSSSLCSAKAPPSQRSLSDDMITKFSQSFQHRSVSCHPSTPTSPSEGKSSVSRSPPKQERALLPPAIQGKLLVPDVRLKIHRASFSSTWSSPTSACSASSQLSVTSEGEEESSSDSASSLPVCRKGLTVESESSFRFTY